MKTWHFGICMEKWVFIGYQTYFHLCLTNTMNFQWTEYFRKPINFIVKMTVLQINVIIIFENPLIIKNNNLYNYIALLCFLFVMILILYFTGI